MRLSHRLAAVVLPCALVAVLAGVVLAAGAPPVVKAGSTGLGKILVDSRGHTLYLFEQSRVLALSHSNRTGGVFHLSQLIRNAALIPFVNHRNDLTYLVGELIGELNSGHTYVAGGERPQTPRVKLGLLGAEFSRDAATRASRMPSSA